MKKILPLSLLLLLIFHVQLFSQNCGNDSVVTHFYWNFDDGDRTKSLIVDSFDLTNGSVYTTTRTGYNALPGAPSYNQDIFTRILLSYNSNHDTVQYMERKGTGSGYTNLKKIDFTYNASNQPLSRIEYYWDGVAWVMTNSETHTYNGNNRVTNYLISDSSGNLSQKNYTYNGNQSNDIVFQNWSGAWVNSMKFRFTYSGNVKDSIYIQNWDLNLNNWADSLSGKFDTSFTAFVTDTFYFFGPTYTMVYQNRIDTLGNILFYSRENITTGAYERNTYSYFNSHLKQTVRVFGDFSYNGDEVFNYDIYGFISSESGSTQSSMSASGSSTDYDSYSRPTHHDYDFGSGVHDSNIEEYYYYSSSSVISAAWYPFNRLYPLSCQGDTVQALGAVNGGCGPLTITWTPATGLSSPNVAEPFIFVHDSITYTINVTDTAGHSTTSTYTVLPTVFANISFDSTLCSGCPVVLSAPTNNNYTYQWYRNDTLIDNANSVDYTAITSGSYTVEVNNGQCTAVSDPVVLTLSGYTRLSGQLYLDVDSNCTYGGSDHKLYKYGPTPFFIKLQRQNYIAYIVPDSNGIYDIPIDTGTFSLSIVNPSLIFTATCPDSGIVNVTIPAYGDTITGVNLALKALYNCERLRVSLGAERFRYCRPTSIHVTCYNEGTTDVSNPVVSVTLPDELINVTSSVPFSNVGNIYTFSLPPISVAAYRTFQINADVRCDSLGLSGATICIDAEISPVNFCSLQPDSTWDGSNIRVSSMCNNGTDVCFIIKNDGIAGGNMNASSPWRLYNDNNLIQQGTFILNAGQDTTLCFVSDGSSYRLEADQTIGFPEPNTPKASIERCGNLAPGAHYSLGEILQTSLDNGLPFYYTYCNIINGSFDPNSKTVSPVGLTANHLVGTNDRLTYRIDFQNTGNDTAYNVKITDYINLNALDLTTLQLMSSSHPYTFSFDEDMFTWQFDSIMLPDSGVDERGSHGYLEFSMLPKSNVPIGTTINNRANIYFDFNAPVITAFATVRICDVQIASVAINQLSSTCPGQPVIAANTLFGGSNPNYKWFVNGVIYNASNDTVTFNNLNNNDTIQLLLFNNSSCSITDSVYSNEIVIHYTQPIVSFVSGQLMSTPAVSYQWFYNNVLIPGATNQSYVPTHTGNYFVRATDASGCTYASDIYYFFSVNIDDPYLNSLKIYPNPADENLMVSGIKGKIQISITDLSGRIVKKTEQSETTEVVTIKTDDIKTGYYLLKVISDNRQKFYPVQIFHRDK